MTDCQCGHSRHYHDYRDGCIKFLCCDRTRNLFPGKRHTEHDGVNHSAKHCPCGRYTVCDTCDGKQVVQAAQVFHHPSGPFVNWRDAQTIPCPKCNQDNN